MAVSPTSRSNIQRADSIRLKIITLAGQITWLRLGFTIAALRLISPDKTC